MDVATTITRRRLQDHAVSQRHGIKIILLSLDTQKIRSRFRPLHNARYRA
jgi:hypothetical protein